MKKNLWILTEERPKKEVLVTILEKFSRDFKYPCFIDSIRIIPVLKNDKFDFLYEVTGFRSNRVNKIYIKTISGHSSFVDFLIFFQNCEPSQSDTPIYAIEETKTDDKESRNTGVYQRCSKFIYLEKYFPSVRKLMLYNIRVGQKKIPTQTYIFGTRLLLSLGVEILGKQLDSEIFKPFKSIDEIIDFKVRMRKAPKGNVPITISKKHNKIFITGRLFKGGSLSHDPSIGALSLISATIRSLGWREEIIIADHGLSQSHVTPENKFVKIASILNLKLENLSIPDVTFNDSYWKYDFDGEKLATIFIHLVVENFTQAYSIFENHAGCEKGYFITQTGDNIPLGKYKDKAKYKGGDKSQIVNIPDLIIIDSKRTEIINIEGKKHKFRDDAIFDLSNYNEVEAKYIKKYYPRFKILRTVVLYGSLEEEISEIQIGFLLNTKGDLILGIKAPRIFIEAIKNLKDFWK